MMMMMMMMMMIFRGFQMRGQERGSVDHFWPLGHRVMPFDREYLENCKSQRYVSISATSAR